MASRVIAFVGKRGGGEEKLNKNSFLREEVGYMIDLHNIYPCNEELNQVSRNPKPPLILK